MPWIECHHDFFDHPKTLRLARLLHCPEERAAMGLLRFWVWCLEYVPDGDLREYEPAHLARAFRYPVAKGDRLVSALIEAGWLDVKPYFRVHNWWKHAGPFLLSRYQRRPEAWKKIRSLYEEAPPRDENPETMPEILEITEERTPAAGLQHTCSTVAAGCHLTKHNQTEPDQTRQDHHPHPLPPPRAGGGGGGGGGFEELMTNIFRKSGAPRFSPDDEGTLRDLHGRHGPVALRACSWLHSGVKNVPAYLKAVLEKQNRVEVIAARAREILRAEGREAN
jgi:hypothetical protein